MPSYFGGNEDGDSRGDSLAQTITSTIVDGLVHTVAHWKVLLLGQAVSIVLAIAGGTNEVLSLECKVSTPSTYNAFGYCVVGIFGGVLLKWEERKKLRQGEDDAELRHIHDGSAKSGDTHEGNEDENDGEEDVNDDLTLEDDDSPSKRTFFSLSRRSRNAEKSNNGSCSDKTKKGRKKQLQYPFLFGLFTIQAKWWYYFTVAFIEAQAYYFIFLAFRYTTFTFVYVSDALAIPAAMLFTKLIMKRSYLWTHLIGGAVCMTGIIVNTVSDINDSHADGHELSSDHVKGDILAILGAILLGLDDVLSEIIVSDYGGVTEMVFMKGFFGTLISIVQLVAFEMDSVQALFGDNGRSPCDLSWRMILFSTHVVTRALDVAGEMQFLFFSEAALLNLSLLTSDLYAAIFDVMTTGLQLTIHFYIAFFLIFAGIVLYEAGPSPANIHQGATPLDIQIRKRKSIGYETNNLSVSETEHTSNLGVLKQIELT